MKFSVVLLGLPIAALAKSTPSPTTPNPTPTPTPTVVLPDESECENIANRYGEFAKYCPICDPVCAGLEENAYWDCLDSIFRGIKVVFFDICDSDVACADKEVEKGCALE